MRFLLAALLIALAASGARAAETIETLPTRPGVSIGFIVTAPDRPPVATAILFSGGDGNLKLWRGRIRLKNNFLVRSRALFAEAGVLALTLDAPSDLREDGLADFRGSAAHRADVEAVIRWARARAPVPVWLIGTSRGTVSVAHLAASGLAIDGAVLSASVTEPGRRGRPTALDAALERIAVPVLLVHHRGDRCHITPSDGTARLRARLTRAARAEIRLFAGGSPAAGPCKAKSEHGYYGIERAVVAAIARWIAAATPATPARR